MLSTPKSTFHQSILDRFLAIASSTAFNFRRSSSRRDDVHFLSFCAAAAAAARAEVIGLVGALVGDRVGALTGALTGEVGVGFAFKGGGRTTFSGFFKVFSEIGKENVVI